jgi:hypothetical protein
MVDSTTQHSHIVVVFDVETIQPQLMREHDWVQAHVTGRIIDRLT